MSKKKSPDVSKALNSKPTADPTPENDLSNSENRNFVQPLAEVPAMGIAKLKAGANVDFDREIDFLNGAGSETAKDLCFKRIHEIFKSVSRRPAKAIDEDAEMRNWKQFVALVGERAHIGKSQIYLRINRVNALIDCLGENAVNELVGKPVANDTAFLGKLAEIGPVEAKRVLQVYIEGAGAKHANEMLKALLPAKPEPEADPADDDSEDQDDDADESEPTNKPEPSEPFSSPTPADDALLAGVTHILTALEATSPADALTKVTEMRRREEYQKIEIERLQSKVERVEKERDAILGPVLGEIQKELGVRNMKDALKKLRELKGASNVAA